MKRCSHCKQEHPTTEFHKNACRPDGLADWCKECVREYNAQHREENAERNRRWVEEFKANDPEGYMEWKRHHRRAWRKKNPDKWRAQKRRWHARQRELSLTSQVH